MASEEPKNISGSKPHNAPPAPAINWIEAANNPWGVRVLDVRPITLTMLSTSKDPECAKNAVSFGQDDGTSFIGKAPPAARRVEANLRFPVDRLLADGVLFIPRKMEHKWALFYHLGMIICVRSWLRQVETIARVEAHQNYVEVTAVRGTFGGENEDPKLTVRVLDYLLRSHALDTVYPAPLPAGSEKDPRAAALWCMSMFGDRASFATPHPIVRRDPEKPLRTYSLLHIAVARGNTAMVEAKLAQGIPVDLLAADGLAPLHWAVAGGNPAIMNLLLDRGSSVDVRSSQGATPLMNAVQPQNLETLAFLIGRGADVNARDQRGFTALHRAAEMGHVDAAKLLLDGGASPSPEADGQTPRSLAESRGQKAIVALLSGAGG